MTALAELRERSGDRWIAENAAPLLVVVCGMSIAVWTIYLLLDGEQTDTVIYTNLFLCFMVLGGIYLSGLGRRWSAWCSVPAMVTVQGMIGFAIMPTYCFLSDTARMDGDYVKALSYALAGYAVFWGASWILRPATSIQFCPRTSTTPYRTTLAALLLLVVGILATILEWKLGILSYLADRSALATQSAVAQWLGAAAQLLEGAALVSGCEVLGKGSRDGTIRVVFYASIAVLLFTGALSGMKGALVLPIVLVAMLGVLLRGRIYKFVWLVFPLLILAAYPFVSAYRLNLNAGYRAQSNTAGGLESTLGKSFADAFSGKSIFDSDAVNDNIEASTSRLSLLKYVHDTLSVPNTSLLEGDERVYLAPVYPFIPRFLWKNKPVLDKGHRFSVALGIPSTSSTALTIIGDMYVLGGLSGVLCGMALFGTIGQLYMNLLGSRWSEKKVFFFMATFSSFTNLEHDVVSLIAGAVQAALIFLIISYAIYGGGLFSLEGATSMPSGETR